MDTYVKEELAEEIKFSSLLTSEPCSSGDMGHFDEPMPFNLNDILQRDTAPSPRIETFPATRVDAKNGKHNVFYYRMYGPADLCYVFQWKRNLKAGVKSYHCGACKALGETNKLEIVGETFLSDPCSLNHICTPLYWPTEAAKRRLFNITKRVRNTSDNEKPSEVFKRMVEEVMNDSSLTDEEKKATVEAMGPYEKHRRTLSRAVNTPSRVTAIEKRKRDEECTNQQIEDGLNAVEKLLVTVRETRELLQEPSAKRPRFE